jgi:hypothetical protein
MKIKLLQGIVLPLFIAAISLFANNANAQQKAKAITGDTVELKNALNYVSKLRPVSSGQQYNLLADDVQSILPGVITQQIRWVSVGKNNPKATTYNTVDLEKLVPVLVGAIKEQQAEIDKLKAEVRQLQQMQAAR